MDVRSDTGSVLIKLQRGNASSEAGIISSHLPTQHMIYRVHIG